MYGARHLWRVVDGTEIMGKKEKEMRLLFFSSVVLGHLLGKIQSVEIAIGLLEQPDTPGLLNSQIPSTLPLFIYQVN